MAAVSILKKIIVLAYLVFHAVATNSSNKVQFQLAENAAEGTELRRGKGSKSGRSEPSSPSTPQISAPSPLTPPKADCTCPPTIPAAPAPLTQQLEFADQRLAAVYPIIQRFKRSITSDPFNVTGTWVGGNICNYTGFYCSNPPDNVTAITVASIDFNGYRLGAPTLDGFIDQIPDLALFHANSNFFGGIIPSNITNLRYFYELDLSNNIFSGTFPSAVVGLNGLIFLDIRFNLFSGTVPPGIFIQNLYVLFLNDNTFMSTLPDILGSNQILYLTLQDNKFTGPIPSDIDIVFANLTEVLLLNNQFSGCIPYEVGLLKQVTLFDISKNLLTGPLPLSLGCLQNAQVLNFSENLLYGWVHDLICRLPNLVKLTLSNNYFTHVGKECWPLIKSGVLDVSNNCILGLPFQRPIIECLEFFAVPRFCPHVEPHKLIPCKLPPPW